MSLPVIQRSEATKNLLSFEVKQSRSFAALRMTGRETTKERES